MTTEILKVIQEMRERKVNHGRDTSATLEAWADRLEAALSQQAEPASINQCDGCQAGVPVDEKGNHRMGKPGGYADLMRCEKTRYVSEPAPAQDEREASHAPAWYGAAEAEAWAAGFNACSAAAPIAQTEQQPIRLPERKNLDGLRDPESKRAGMAYNEAIEDVELLNAAPIAQTAPQPELTVWEGKMPESNGKSNFTAILMRKDAEGFDGFTDGMTIARSEYPDRVRYEADCVRYLLGELKDKPWITDYDTDKHSGYVPPARAAE